MSYVAGVAAVTVASAIAVLMTSGGRFEKFCCAVCCMATALSVVLPVYAMVKSTGDEIYKEALAVYSEKAEDEVVSRCTEKLEEESEKALLSKFPECEAASVVIETDASDPENVLITAVRAELDCADEREAVKFLSELLYCEKVEVVITGGEESEY